MRNSVQDNRKAAPGSPVRARYEEEHDGGDRTRAGAAAPADGTLRPRRGRRSVLGACHPGAVPWAHRPLSLAAELRASLGRLPRVDLGVGETPFEPLPRLSELRRPGRLHQARRRRRRPTRWEQDPHARVRPRQAWRSAPLGRRWIGRPVQLLASARRSLRPARPRLPPRPSAVATRRRAAPGIAASRPPVRRRDRVRATTIAASKRVASPNLPTGSRPRVPWCTASRRRATPTRRCMPPPTRADVELLDQCAVAGVEPTHVYVSTLDTTHAGLLLGLRTASRRRRYAPSHRTNGRSSPTARSRRRSPVSPPQPLSCCTCPDVRRR